MTATLIGSDLDTDIEDEVDLAPPPPMCDGVAEDLVSDCPREAKFKTHTACCGTIFLFCDDCVIHIMKEVKTLPPSVRHCARCDKLISDPPNHLIYDGRL